MPIANERRSIPVVARVLLRSLGKLDSMWQTTAYWIMGAITNDPFKLARYAGFYKALQSAGSAGSFGMDAVATPFLNEHVRHVPLFINLKVRR